MNGSSPVALGLDSVSHAFGRFRVLSDVSLTVESDELRCIIGPNGAGKSTLFNVIAGALVPTSGTVSLRDVDITGWSPDARARAGIARSFQTPRLCEALSVFENVRLAVQTAYQLPNPVASRYSGVIVEKAWRALEVAKLASRAAEPAAVLSHAERAWLQFALTSARHSTLVLLDEPTAGMSHSDVERLAGFLADFRRDRTIVLIEHDLDFVKGIADRISVLDNGEHVVTGTPAQIAVDENVRKAYLGGT